MHTTHKSTNICTTVILLTTQSLNVGKVIEHNSTHQRCEHFVEVVHALTNTSHYIYRHLETAKNNLYTLEETTGITQ